MEVQGCLKELLWPIENGEIDVNSSVFTIATNKNNALRMRDLWAQAMKAQV
jgi:hypothetical protein